jgi:16S rRNA (cytosine967-C5)-methyltransferase
MCAFVVIRRVFEQGAYADRALQGQARALPARDRALAMTLAYGTVQRRATLDHAIELFGARSPGRLERPLLAALRLGLYQLLYLDGVACYAAVSDSVELAKVCCGRGAGALANALLRRAAREREQLLGSLCDRTAAQAALMHSVPQWLAQLWFDQLGAARARSLLAAANRPAEAAVRVNMLRATPEEVLRALPAPARPAGAQLPEGLVLCAPFDAHGSDAFAHGMIMPQSRASMLVSRVLDPVAGERVLDLCAAPGAKTTHLAALMGGRGELVAVERHPGRATALQRTCARMGARNVTVVAGDALAGFDGAQAVQAADWGGPFDRVLLDPPCSGLGTLQSRPDLRWRAQPQRIAELAGLQRRLLSVAARQTAPGGTLVYSVCTVSAAECEQAVEGLLDERGDFEICDLGKRWPQWRCARAPAHLQLLPDRDQTDGFFIACLRRAA